MHSRCAHHEVSVQIGPAKVKYTILIYYENTNQIPGELSRENLVSSHVKITCYLHM